MSVAQGLGGTFWWPSWKIYTRGKQTGYSGVRATLHARTCFGFFLDPFPSSFRPKPCKYYVKTPWNTAFLLCHPSFMFTLVSMINQISLSIMIIDCLCVSSQMNNRLTNDFYIFCLKKKADLNWTKIRHSWLLLFKIIKYVDIRVQFWGWFGNKK